MSFILERKEDVGVRLQSRDAISCQSNAATMDKTKDHNGICMIIYKTRLQVARPRECMESGRAREAEVQQ